MVPDFGDVLAASMARIAEEAPRHHRRLCEVLLGEEVAISVDGRTTVVRFDRGGVTVGGPVGNSSVCVRTSREAILDLADGRVTLLEAVLTDRLELVGHRDAILRFHDGLLVWFHGAVRSPTVEILLDAYRGRP